MIAPTPLTPAPRQDLAGRVLVVAEAVERRVAELTAIIEQQPCPDAVAELSGLLWVAFMLRPLTAGPRARQTSEAGHE